jgi:ubiquinone/menaquinone biosynthesis C-methylase UbiE
MADSVFDLHTEEYDDWFNRNQSAYLTELLALKRELTAGKRGIDIGVGTARFAQALNISFGVDISYPMVEVAQSRGCTVAVADAEHLPFKTDAFDYALLMVTLCFVKRPGSVIREARRIIAENGKLIVGIIDKKSSLGKRYHKKKSMFYETAHFYSTEEVIGLLRSNRLRDITTWQTLFENPEEMNTLNEVKKGYGKGGFVIMSGAK